MSHPIRAFLVESGYPVTDAGEYWRTTAKFRGGKTPTSLAINKRTGGFKDFSTGRSGTAEELVRIIKGESVDFSAYEPPPEQHIISIPKVYPKEILNRLLPQFDFFLGRGISLDTLKTFEGGMAHSGKLNRRVCFPIYDRNGRIIGFAGRWFKEFPFGQVPKWKLLGKKSEWLFPCHLNESVIRERREVIVVESIGDLLALWEAGIRNAICIFGTSMSSRQLSYVLGLNCNKIIIATNNDPSDKEPGQRAAERIKAKLVKHYDDTYIGIHLPTEKDFGIMSSDQIKSWYAEIPH